jgi:ribokinase
MKHSQAGPIVVVGAHAQGLFLHVTSIPAEGESVLGFNYREPRDGGKASNQAVAAARLGAPTVLVSVVGNDERGREARAYLKGQGVDVRWCRQADGPTDVGFVLLPPSAVPAIATAQDCSRELDEDAVLQAEEPIARASLVICQLEAPAAAALAAFAIAKRAGARTLLNASPAMSLPSELIRLTDVLVPNEHEAATLAGASGHAGDLACRLARQWMCEAVIVTAGAAGAYVATGGTLSHVPARTTRAVDTTGAGDAFLGALAVRLRDGGSFLDATGFAVRAATLSVTRAGTMDAFASAAELTAERLDRD